MSLYEMGRIQLRQRSVMLRHNEISEGRIYVAEESIFRNTDFCNMEELVETKESTERRSSFVTRKFMSRQMTLTF